MPDADMAAQLEHVVAAGTHSRTSPEPLRTHSAPQLRGHDAGRILATVLQDRQRIVDTLVNRGGPPLCRRCHT